MTSVEASAVSGPTDVSTRGPHPLAWVMLAATILLVVGSLASRGTGPYGLGIVMGVVWLWVLLPVLAVLWFILARRGGMSLS